MRKSAWDKAKEYLKMLLSKGRGVVEQTRQSPIAQAARSYLATPLTQKQTKVYDKLQSIINAPITQIPRQFTSGMVSGSNLGMQGFAPPPTTTATKVANIGGSFVGAMNPYSLTGRVIKPIVNFTNPILAKVISPVANRAITGRLASGVANVAQGAAINPVYGRRPFEGAALDFTTGVAFGPNQFSKILPKQSFTMDKITMDELVEAGEMLKNPKKYIGIVDTGKRTQKEAIIAIKNQANEIIERLSARYLPDKQITTLKTAQAKIKALVDLSSQNKLANVEGMEFVGKNQVKEISKSKTTTLKASQIEPKPILKTTGGGGPSDIPKTASSPDILSDKDLISQMSKAIKEAKPIRGAQEELYAKARSQKLAKLMSARGRVKGEKGYFAELGALKGELPKAEFETIRSQFTQTNVDRLFDMVRQNKSLDDWDKVAAQKGLANILGKEGGGVPTTKEIEHLYKVFGKEFTETLLTKRPFLEKLGSGIMQAYNVPRSMMAGVGDLSATLMQNIMFAYRHPVMTVKNLGKQLKMFASENYYKMSGEEIASRPNYKLMKQANISFTDVGPMAKGREEQFMSAWAEKIPGLGKVIQATGRAYTGFLNRMRADVFDQLVDTQKSLGLKTDGEFLKKAGGFVNSGTGRGSLGALEKNANLLAQGLFSARKLVATANFLNPANYVSGPKVVRQEYLKTALSFIAGGALITQLAKLSGAKVGDDPTSADYGKIKIGNTRFNVWGQYQQLAVLLARLWKGYGTSSTTGKKFTLGEGYKPTTRLDLITRFFESKEHPTLSLILGAIRGQNQIGEAFNAPTETLRRFIPMVLSDGYDLYQEHGPKGLLGAIPMILGVPSQTYGRQELVTGENQLGQPTSQVKPAGDIAEKIVGKFKQQPLQSSSSSSVQVYLDQLNAMPREQAATQFDKIIKTNPELAKKLNKEIKDRAKGITVDDQLLKSKGVASGDRALAIQKEFNKLKTKEEKATLWDHYVKVGIITKDVAKQLKEIL